MREVRIGEIVMGQGNPIVLIAGPCVIEDYASTISIAKKLKEIKTALGIPLIFKASYDKANRSSVDSYRGPGLKEGLEILRAVKREVGLPVLSDVHRFEEIGPAAEILDVLQVPAFLCRQTDFVMEVARQAKVINVKKGQFMAPWEMGNVVEKVKRAGNENLIITERGTVFGYNNLVVDFRSLPLMKAFGFPVVFDATHSVQQPGGLGKASGGDREMALYLARAAVAVGVDGIFCEVHPDPDCALCDGPNSLRLSELDEVIREWMALDGLVKARKG
ncbi:MAG TPA: 3-deoxy-8-phosphooctulonate synthase [Syntrophales bacterium]|nr:3-deoxy-8-phosphooctulonate synthase [Syntrophales bacterium]HOL59815.1 3-deoxy-8-phosphooctulonate synthase [Syntrophales bacterium]HPO35967.1 3-deoxy-8-phosphooctulonate synthase [Syntrophales bacterium]